MRFVQEVLPRGVGIIMTAKKENREVNNML